MGPGSAVYSGGTERHWQRAWLQSRFWQRVAAPAWNLIFPRCSIRSVGDRWWSGFSIAPRLWSQPTAWWLWVIGLTWCAPRFSRCPTWSLWSRQSSWAPDTLFSSCWGLSKVLRAICWFSMEMCRCCVLRLCKRCSRPTKITAMQPRFWRPSCLILAAMAGCSAMAKISSSKLSKIETARPPKSKIAASTRASIASGGPIWLGCCPSWRQTTISKSTTWRTRWTICRRWWRWMRRTTKKFWASMTASS